METKLDIDSEKKEATITIDVSKEIEENHTNCPEFFIGNKCKKNMSGYNCRKCPAGLWRDKD